MTSSNDDAAERPTLWQRLKPLWWMRGIAGALALIGVLNLAGWIREDWLRIPHAVASRWREMLGRIADWLNVHLPWHLELTRDEAVRLAGMSAILFPIAFGQIGRLERDAPPNKRIWQLILVSAVVLAIAIPWLGGDIVQQGWWGSLWAMSVIVPSVYTSMQQPAEGIARKFALALLCIIPVSGLASFVFGLPLEQAALALMVATITLLLWMVARRYFKVMLITVTFLLTLEAFYLLPGLQRTLQPVVEWVDPQ